MGTSLAGCSVLIAEDEFLVAFHWETVLEEHGASVKTAASVEDAMPAAQDGIDCAVLDVSLLDGDVFPIADILQARGIPFVFHSGHANLDDLVGRYPGAEALTKPATEAVMVRALERVLGTKATDGVPDHVAGSTPNA